MGLAKIGDRVYNIINGEGTIKRLFSKTNVAVEFDKFMDGHDCCGSCKDGHGWYCYIRPKAVAVRLRGNDECVYLLEEDGWD